MFTNIVIVIRLTAFGDILIAVHLLKKLKLIGLEPIFCVHETYSEIPKAVNFLNYFATFSNPKQMSFYQKKDDVWSKFELANLAKDHKWPILDLQVNGRSRRAVKYLRKTCSSCENVIKVKKRSFHRIISVCKTFFCFKQTVKKNPVVFTPRITELQENTLIKFNLTSYDNYRQDDKFIIWNLQVEEKFISNHISKKNENIALFLAASHKLKAWPIKNFIELCYLIISKTNAKIIIFGGTNEIEVGAIIEDHLKKQLNTERLINLTGKLTSTQSLALIKNVNYLVSGDSFPAHAAQHFGTNASVLFGATSPSFGFTPKANNIKIHYLNLTCSPCSRHGAGKCRFGNLKCLVDISPNSVFGDIPQALKKSIC